MLWNQDTFWQFDHINTMKCKFQLSKNPFVILTNQIKFLIKAKRFVMLMNFQKEYHIKLSSFTITFHYYTYVPLKLPHSWDNHEAQGVAHIRLSKLEWHASTTSKLIPLYTKLKITKIKDIRSKLHVRYSLKYLHKLEILHTIKYLRHIYPETIMPITLNVGLQLLLHEKTTYFYL